MSDEPSNTVAHADRTGTPEKAPGAGGLRASDRDRDQVLVRLHSAFAEGRLTEPELDERIERALAARTMAELSALSADLPDPGTAHAAPVGTSGKSGFGGRFQLAYKSGIRRGGRWRLPERHTTVVYKGTALVDLRNAELESAETTLRVVAYKSNATIIVPPGVRVDAGGLGVSTELHTDPTPDAPLIRLKGLAYKGAIDITDQHREPEPRRLPTFNRHGYRGHP
ncbi:DUF1707 SHOCT-like domain-containing protein [Actinomadura rupiterrae]|uniref:DUF1707 SHOCT-like domain-containing protein n=1 Tax=Actinomadura rupiterrae TaxID=559627 RepID=UPI0020A2E4BC|nr:DUF1707 domain-containing protein [Actinomadura rupiterrae]MCP2340042.1 hypothetical protein [Actinomadura rupiterrae]